MRIDIKKYSNESVGRDKPRWVLKNPVGLVSSSVFLLERFSPIEGRSEMVAKGVSNGVTRILTSRLSYIVNDGTSVASSMAAGAICGPRNGKERP